MLKLYIYSVFISNLYANGITNYKIIKKLNKEGYNYIDNQSTISSVIELLINSIEYFIPIYNIIKTSYIALNFEEVYETYKDDCLLDGIIVSREDIDKIKELTNEITDINKDIYKEPIKSKLLDIDTVVWKNMTEEERKELLREVLKVNKEKKKENIIVKTLRKYN